MDSPGLCVNLCPSGLHVPYAFCGAGTHESILLCGVVLGLSLFLSGGGLVRGFSSSDAEGRLRLLKPARPPRRRASSLAHGGFSGTPADRVFVPASRLTRIILLCLHKPGIGSLAVLRLVSPALEGLTVKHPRLKATLTTRLENVKLRNKLGMS